jgi:hypothetical protein
MQRLLGGGEILLQGTYGREHVLYIEINIDTQGGELDKPRELTAEISDFFKAR